MSAPAFRAVVVLCLVLLLIGAAAMVYLQASTYQFEHALEATPTPYTTPTCGGNHEDCPIVSTP